MTPAARPTFTMTARRSQLIDAAIATVNEIGYHRTSLAEIARRAGVAKSATVYYFSSRDALLLAVVDDVFTLIGQVITDALAVAAPGPDAQLRAYCGAYIDGINRNRAAATAAIEIAVSHRLADGTPLYLTGTDEDSAELRDILQRGMDSGAFRRMPLGLATSFVESLLDAAMTELQRDVGADLETLREQAPEFVVQGLAPQPPCPAPLA